MRRRAPDLFCVPPCQLLELNTATDPAGILIMTSPGYGANACSGIPSKIKQVGICQL